MDPLIIGGLVAGASNLIGQGVTNTQNRKLSKYSYQQDLAMWHRQNAYNHPSQQMARLKQAGLNPNLVYGTGSVGNTSAPPPKYDTPEYQLDTKLPLMETISNYATMKETQARTNNLNQSTANLALDGGIKAVEKAILETEAKQRGVALDRDTQLSKYQVEGARLDNEKRLKDLDLTGAQIKKVESETRLKDTQQDIAQQEKLLKTFEALWAEKGITKSDSIYVRVLSRALDEGGISLESAMEDIKKYIMSLPKNLFD